MKIGQVDGVCPLCGAPATLVDLNEVDIGVGSMTFDHEWSCSTHGEFGNGGDRMCFRDSIIDREYAASDAGKKDIAFRKQRMK